MKFKRRAFTTITAAVFILFGLAATACGDREQITTVVASVPPSPTSETDTPAPTPPPSATPEPPTTTPNLPTPTPQPPTATPAPTPTPTVQESKLALIGQMGWYGNAALEEDTRSSLEESLCALAIDHPTVFDAVIRRGWIDPPDQQQLDVVASVVRRLLALAQIEETVALDVLAMQFLDSVEPVESFDNDYLIGAEIHVLDSLVLLAGRASGDFGDFLESLPFDGGILDEYLIYDDDDDSKQDLVEDIFYFFVQWDDPELAGEIDMLTEHVTFAKDIVQFYYSNPMVYRQLYDGLSARGASASAILNFILVAELDSGIALSISEMPVATTESYLEPWFELRLAMRFDTEKVREIVNTYADADGIVDADVPELFLQLIGVYAPEVSEMLAALPWISDGIRPIEFRIEDGRRINRSGTGEDEVLLTLLEWVSEPDRPALIKLLEKDWIQDAEIDRLERQTLRSLVGNFSGEEGEVLLDLQFLASIENDDRFALSRLIHMNAPEVELDFPFQDILEHPRFNGDITNENQCYLERVIEELRPGSERVPPNPGEGEPC